MQYADFALWQQRVYDETAIAQQLDYWQRKLSDDHVVASGLVCNRSLSKQAKRYFVDLDLAQAIQSLNRTLGVTSFVVLLAGLKLALAQWSKQQEIWTIATVGNRTIPQTESMLGCFINDVILRSHISPEQTVASLIQQLHTDVNEAIAHKDIPLERVIEHTKRSHPLNIMASVTITSSANIQQIPNWEVLEVQTQPQFENMPSQLYADDIPLEFYIEMSQTLRIGVNYSIEQFTANSIEQLLTQYQEILKKLVVQPEITCLELFETV